jgi:hypothetical protein
MVVISTAFMLMLTLKYATARQIEELFYVKDTLEIFDGFTLIKTLYLQ